MRHPHLPRMLPPLAGQAGDLIAGPLECQNPCRLRCSEHLPILETVRVALPFLPSPCSCDSITKPKGRQDIAAGRRQPILTARSGGGCSAFGRKVPNRNPPIPRCDYVRLLFWINSEPKTGRLLPPYFPER